MTYEPKTRLASMNIGGNLHDVRRYCNEIGLADFIVTAESSGYNSVVLFRLPLWWECDSRGPLPANAQKEAPAGEDRG
jgi:hypothetical protein